MCKKETERKSHYHLLLFCRAPFLLISCALKFLRLVLLLMVSKVDPIVSAQMMMIWALWILMQMISNMVVCFVSYHCYHHCQIPLDKISKWFILVVLILAYLPICFPDNNITELGALNEALQELLDGIQVALIFFNWVANLKIIPLTCRSFSLPSETIS